jgi:hypothetical protein
MTGAATDAIASARTAVHRGSLDRVSAVFRLSLAVATKLDMDVRFLIIFIRFVFVLFTCDRFVLLSLVQGVFRRPITPKILKSS